jgi:hypothetical protein
MRRSLNQGCTVNVTGLEANSLWPGVPEGMEGDDARWACLAWLVVTTTTACLSSR